jgi:asparaginyl-tRNA synthetase
MRQNEDNKTVAAMDVLFPGIGEIIGGSQREERYGNLLARIKRNEPA